MTIPASGTLDLDDINTELQESAGTAVDLGSNGTLALAGLAGGSAFTFPDDWYGEDKNEFIATLNANAGAGATRTWDINLGPAGTGKRVGVIVRGRDDGILNLSITSVTIAGVTATQRVENAFNDGVSKCLVVGIFDAAVNASGNQDVVVAFSSAPTGCAVDTFRLSQGGTIHDTASDDAQGSGATVVASSTIDIPSRGCLVVGAFSTDNVSGWSFSGSTEVVDGGSDGLGRKGAGFTTDMSSQSGRSISATATRTGGDPAGVVMAAASYAT